MARKERLLAWVGSRFGFIQAAIINPARPVLAFPKTLAQLSWVFIFGFINRLGFCADQFPGDTGVPAV